MANRLAQSQSLYLRKHAENPIDWWPWCDAALEKAKQENKPIFLSIGYSSCHWCTVMEGEAFSDRAIADYMNANFVPIKVDREERPDLDSIYMQSLQMMTGQGGWPLNVFLSPQDRVPFYGGTYFPLEAKYGRPGFLQVLQAIRRFYDTEPGKIAAVKEEILERLQQSAVLPGNEELSASLLNLGLQYSAGILAAQGVGPRFPMIPYAEAGLHGIRLMAADAQYDAAAATRQRGVDLALGGIYDHVAGGFHRYTVDANWTVPHFEKMLYDNGQIVEFLSNLWSLGVKEPAFERAIAGTVQWLQREMTEPQGYFYAAQDADSFVTPDEAEPEEGAFYVWSYEELQRILTAVELAELAEQFSISPTGNFEGKIVLQRLHPGELSGAIESSLSKLFAIRYGDSPASVKPFPAAPDNSAAKTTAWPGRIPCVTDTKMIVAWNSLMISGLARAAAVFQNPVYADLASQAAQFILRHQFVEGRFQRLNYAGQATVLAQSEDYALFIKALLDLDQATLNRSDAHPWWQSAMQLQAEFDEYLWSVELGGYYNTSASGDLVVRERSYDDNATPSANGVAIANLVRLALRTENLDYLDRAEQALLSFSGMMARVPQACPSLFTALDWWRNLTLIRTTQEQISHLNTQYLPTATIALAPDLLPEVVGLVCQGLSCKAPARTTEQFQQQIEQSQRRGGLV
jgi:hypothetical protein